eukprot:9394372-Alexandrium_andersonii.AAC.1
MASPARGLRVGRVRSEHVLLLCPGVHPSADERGHRGSKLATPYAPDSTVSTVMRRRKTNSSFVMITYQPMPRCLLQRTDPSAGRQSERRYPRCSDGSAEAGDSFRPKFGSPTRSPRSAESTVKLPDTSRMWAERRRCPRKEFNTVV